MWCLLSMYVCSEIVDRCCGFLNNISSNKVCYEKLEV